MTAEGKPFVTAPARAGRPTLAKAELQEIADRIRDRHRRTIADIVATGQDLIRVKAALDHGRFSEWIEGEFSMSIRTAQNYMQAFELTSGKSETVALLPPAMLYKLAAKSTPEEIKADVLKSLEAGKKPDIEQIEARIHEARNERRTAPNPAQIEPHPAGASASRRRSRAEVKEDDDRRNYEGCMGILDGLNFNLDSLPIPKIDMEKRKANTRIIKRVICQLRVLAKRLGDGEATPGGES